MNLDKNIARNVGSSVPYGGIAALVVEDDPLTGKWLRHQLEKRNIRCELCESYEAAEEQLTKRDDFNLFMLDYTLGIDSDTGLDLCRKIRRKSTAPIIFVSGNRNADIITNCLEAGADQFLLKPVHSDIMTAHINSTLRRVYGGNWTKTHEPKIPSEPVLTISLDEAMSLLRCEDRECSLSKRELAVMEILMAGFSHLVGREEIIFLTNSVVMQVNNRYLDNLISSVRKKLSSITDKYEIMTIRSLGYALVQKENSRLKLNDQLPDDDNTETSNI